MTKLRAFLLLPILFIFISGCGPIKASYYLNTARKMLKEAEKSNAPKYAPYEYTLAYECYKKAKEEQGYSEYEASDRFARKAIKFAEESKKKAVLETEDIVGQDIEEIPEKK